MVQPRLGSAELGQLISASLMIFSPFNPGTPWRVKGSMIVVSTFELVAYRVSSTMTWVKLVNTHQQVLAYANRAEVGVY